jgi:geranylgeranyl diphosphate synthase, type II
LADELSQYLTDKRSLVESQLRTALHPGADCPPALLEAMQYSLLAAGKRLRPLLVLLAAEACGGSDANALPAACAVEMVHTYSLIHDDLPAMDNDDLRRGVPTCHKRFGEAMAILAGDALLTLAFQVLAEGYPPTTAAACCRELARAAGAAGMVGGQVEDLVWESGRVRKGESEKGGEWENDGGRSGARAHSATLPISHSLETLENIHDRKTGALFRASLRLGVWSALGERPAGPDPKVLQSLDNYGRCFGQAFQITDDLLDVEGNSLQTGKRVQKDAAHGKLTYPGFLGVVESRARAERLCQEARNHLQPFGKAGDRLAALTRLIVDRQR